MQLHMERQQELKLLGFLGILKESLKLIFSHKKIFTQISVALLIPISIILEVKILTAILFSFKMFKNRAEPEDITVFVIPQYSVFNFSYMTSFNWVALWLFSEITYLIIVLILSVLATITISSTISSVYKSNEDPIPFKNAMTQVPRLWKKVLLTFLLVFLVTFVYDYILGPALGGVLRLLFFKRFAVVKIVFGVILAVMYIVVFVYITLIWRVGTVVSSLEGDHNCYGAKAILKGRRLLKGKMKASVGVFVLILTLSAGVDTAFALVVVYGVTSIWVLRIGIGIALVLLKLMMVLVGFVAQAVIYFMCKSYHDEDLYGADEVQKPPFGAVQSNKLPV